MSPHQRQQQPGSPVPSFASLQVQWNAIPQQRVTRLINTMTMEVDLGMERAVLVFHLSSFSHDFMDIFRISTTLRKHVIELFLN